MVERKFDGFPETMTRETAVEQTADAEGQLGGVVVAPRPAPTKNIDSASLWGNTTVTQRSTYGCSSQTRRLPTGYPSSSAPPKARPARCHGSYPERLRSLIICA